MGFTKKDFYKLHLQFANANGFKPTSYKGFKLRITRGWGVVELLATPSKSKIIYKWWSKNVGILEEMPADVLDILVKELNQIRDAGFDERIGYSNMTAERQQKFDKQSLLNDSLELRNKSLIERNEELQQEVNYKGNLLHATNSVAEWLEKQNNDLRRIIFVYSICLGLGGILATILILKYCI
jgi:hypothetical protein